MSDTSINVGMAERGILPKYWLRLFLLLSSIEGIFVILDIFQKPSEIDSARFLGLSSSRLALVSASVIIEVLFLGLLILSIAKREWFDRFQSNLYARLENHYFLFLIAGVSFFGAFASAQILFYLPEAMEPVVVQTLSRLKPLLIWFLLFNLQLILGLLLHYFASRKINKTNRNILIVTFSIFCLLVFIWVGMSLSGYSIREENSENGIFRVPGAPLLGYQVFAVWAVVCCIMFLVEWFKRKGTILADSRLSRIDSIVGILVWALAFFLWMSAPLESSWFVDQPRPPNYSYSPNSDAFVYNTAGHSAIVGEGFCQGYKGCSIRRPMLSALTALFHLIGGLEYEQMIWVQVLFLSLLPVFVFLVTSICHNRYSGFLTALLIIIRQRNAILVADTVTVSHVKLVMSDLPAALGVVLIVWLVLIWLKKFPLSSNYPLIVGGLLGFFTLIRSEMGLLLLAVAAISLWVLRQRLIIWTRGIAFAILGITLVIVPWMWRNSQLRGYIHLDKNLRYSPMMEKFREIFNQSDETSELPDFDDSSSWLPKMSDSDLLHRYPRKGILDTVPNDEVSYFVLVATHFLNGHSQLFYPFPQSATGLIAGVNALVLGDWSEFVESCCSIEGYTRSLPYWWSGWNGMLAQMAIPSILLNISLISFGISILWKRQGAFGLFLLGLASFYISIFAINKLSGGRWLVEVDWIYFMVFSIGIVELTQRTISWFRNESPTTEIEKIKTKIISENSQTNIFIFSTSLLAIALVGFSLIFVETFVPKQYLNVETQTIERTLLDSKNSLLSENDVLALETLLRQNNEKYYARALYPRFFESGDGMDGKFNKFKLPFSRVEFYLVGTHTGLAVIPLESSPDTFPHASDVFVIGCDNEEYFDVAAVVLNPTRGTSAQQILLRDTSLAGEIHCATPPN